METNKITEKAGQIAKTIERYSPTIFTIIGVIGAVSTAIMAVQATPAAMEAIEREKNRRTDMAIKSCTDVSEVSDEIIEQAQKLQFVDYVKICWKIYLPSALMCGTTVASIITSNCINLKRNAAIAGLYSLSQETIREYHHKVVEQIGKKKDQEIRDQIMQERINKTPMDSKPMLISMYGEDYLCYDKFNDRYFKCNLDRINKAVNDFNAEVLKCNYANLNTFYDLIGVPELKNSKAGDISYFLSPSQLELDITTCFGPDGSTPCACIDFNIDELRNEKDIKGL